ncbi:MAG TPA: hypothetical protein PKC30_12160 [Saprospiraceae bacterium]|nr:hypothetical protein [Saprospiraceae bacterium]
MITYLIALILCVHDIHLSVCDFEYFPSSRKVELTIKIFYDDLLEAVGLRMGEELPEDYKSADDLIEKFINKHFAIHVNGKKKVLNYIDSYSYPPAVWSTLEFDQDEEIKEIKIFNTILLELFNDQKNLVNVSYGSKKHVVVMDHKKKEIVIKN